MVCAFPWEQPNQTSYFNFYLKRYSFPCTGGTAGVLLGWGGMQIVTRRPNLRQVGSSLAVDGVFGLYPAWRASRVGPHRSAPNMPEMASRGPNRTFGRCACYGASVCVRAYSC